MQRHIDARTFSGAVTLVARNGRIAHFEAQGLMDLESKKPMQKDAIFRIMSMTKPVVGVVDPDDDRGRQGPADRSGLEVHSRAAGSEGGRAATPAARRAAGAVGGGAAPTPRYYTVPAEREITVRDLLTHTSGLVSGGDQQRRRRARSPSSARRRSPTTSRASAKVPLDFQPGTRWAYSAQAGFDVLARVVEVASGMPFDQFAKQRIFDPLGMKDTSFYPAERQPAHRRRSIAAAERRLRPQHESATS